jgi:hypothetical protein
VTLTLEDRGYVRFGRGDHHHPLHHHPGLDPVTKGDTMSDDEKLAKAIMALANAITEENDLERKRALAQEAHDHAEDVLNRHKPRKEKE